MSSSVKDMRSAMKSKPRVFPLFLLAGVLCGTGCGSGAIRSTIAVIPRDTAEEIWVSEHGGADDAAIERGLRVYWNGPSRDDDVEQQVALSEKAIASHYYGLILSPNNSFALSATIQRAVMQGVPVVILGAPVPIAPEPGLSFVLNDSAKMGQLAAARLREVLGGNGSVAVIGVSALSPGSVERANAFEQALQRNSPGIKVDEKIAGDFSFGEAELAAEQAIRAHPHLNAIVALGLNETRGAAAAAQYADMLKRVKIIGCDQTLDLLFLLRQGVIDSLVVEDTRTMGYLAVKEIAADKNGKPVSASTLVEPVLVTRANVDDPAIQRILSMRWRSQP